MPNFFFYGESPIPGPQTGLVLSPTLPSLPASSRSRAAYALNIACARADLKLLRLAEQHAGDLVEPWCSQAGLLGHLPSPVPAAPLTPGARTRTSQAAWHGRHTRRRVRRPIARPNHALVGALYLTWRYLLLHS